MPKTDLESLNNQLGYLSLANEARDFTSEFGESIKNTMPLQDFVENLDDIQEFWIQKGTTGNFLKLIIMYRKKMINFIQFI